MKKFSDFNIEPASLLFEGKKIGLEEIFNVTIIVNAFKIEDSKYMGKNKSNKRLVLSIKINDINYIVFTGSENLMAMIQLVPEDGFPFETIIKKREKRFKFT